MVANTHAIEADKAMALGMLAPKVGIAALSTVLSEVRSGCPLSSVRGAANKIYWRKLLASVKPVPPIFAEAVAELTEGDNGKLEV